MVLWIGYISNMTMYADLRFDGTILPVLGWWAYDIMFITPFLALQRSCTRSTVRSSPIDLPANAFRYP